MTKPHQTVTADLDSIRCPSVTALDLDLATSYVEANAADADDLALLLDMLGLASKPRSQPMSTDTAPAEMSPADQLANYVDNARQAIAEVANEPAPCGHEKCTANDRLITSEAQKHAGLLIDAIVGLEGDPITAAKVFAILDSAYIFPTISTAGPAEYPTIPAWELHYLFMATLVALYDHAQIQLNAGPAEGE